MDSIIRCKHIFIMYVAHAVIRQKRSRFGGVVLLADGKGRVVTLIRSQIFRHRSTLAFFFQKRP